MYTRTTNKEKIYLKRQIDIKNLFVNIRVVFEQTKLSQFYSVQGHSSPINPPPHKTALPVTIRPIHTNIAFK